jgi:hypothetical protein
VLSVELSLQIICCHFEPGAWSVIELTNCLSQERVRVELTNRLLPF